MLELQPYIQNDLKPLQIGESVQQALTVMEEYGFGEWPIEDGPDYLGMVKEETLFDAENSEGSLGKFKPLLSAALIAPQSHVFEAIRICSVHQINVLPIVEGQRYKGYLALSDVVHDIGSQISFSDPGSLLVLHMNVQDFSHVQIAQIIESEDAKITALLSFSVSDNEIGVVLKINQRDLSRIIRSFERYNYKINEVYHEALFDDSGERSLNSLINYLKV